MKARLVRTGKNMSLSSPQFFFAQDRALADEAFAGDCRRHSNHGTLRSADTLTEGEDITFVGVPSFAPGNRPPGAADGRDEGEEAQRGRCSRCRRRASCRCFGRVTARRPWSAWSVRSSSTC